MINILTLGSPMYANFIYKYLKASGWDYKLFTVDEGCNLPEDYKKVVYQLVIFTGGSDVDPSIYGHKTFEYTYSNLQRDEVEKSLFKEFFLKRTPMLGICRGSQFLWTMLGGKLFQHVEHHNGSSHSAIDIATGRVFSINSTHHQMADILSLDENTTKIQILALSDPPLSRSHYRWSREMNEFESVENIPEVEAWIHPQRNVLGIQWHPEMLGCPAEGRDYAIKQIRKIINV